jgi:hypothetical protein
MHNAVHGSLFHLWLLSWVYQSLVMYFYDMNFYDMNFHDMNFHDMNFWLPQLGCFKFNNTITI